MGKDKKEIEVIAPNEVIEPTNKEAIQEIHLKRGEVILEIISGKDSGKVFKTSERTAKKYYSNQEIYKEVKKNT